MYPVSYWTFLSLSNAWQNGQYMHSLFLFLVYTTCMHGKHALPCHRRNSQANCTILLVTCTWFSCRIGSSGTNLIDTFMCVVKAITLLYILTTGKRSTFTQTTKPVTKIITYVTYERSKMSWLVETWPL